MQLFPFKGVTHRSRNSGKISSNDTYKNYVCQDWLLFIFLSLITCSKTFTFLLCACIMLHLHWKWTDHVASYGEKNCFHFTFAIHFCRNTSEKPPQASVKTLQRYLSAFFSTVEGFHYQFLMPLFRLCATPGVTEAQRVFPCGSALTLKSLYPSSVKKK